MKHGPRSQLAHGVQVAKASTEIMMACSLHDSDERGTNKIPSGSERGSEPPHSIWGLQAKLLGECRI